MAEPSDCNRAFRLPRASTSDLRGRQSVRATFKLTEACISAISIVATHLGIKQKSLFDHLVDDAETLETIARELKDRKLKNASRVQKTFVISRKSLYSLEAAAKYYNAPRDALVEYSVQRLMPVIVNEQKKHHHRKKIFRALTEHYRSLENLLAGLEANLGAEDPIYDRVASLTSYYRNTHAAVQTFIEKGRAIEAFNPELLRHLLLSGKR